MIDIKASSLLCFDRIPFHLDNVFFAAASDGFGGKSALVCFTVLSFGANILVLK